MFSIQKPIVLVGMMGVGKSYIGSHLAQRLGCAFSDSDKVIEEKAGCSIPEVFQRDGEPKFRDVEGATIIALLDQPAHVIATGGGAVMREETMATIKRKAISIWLRADIDSIMERVSKNENRPLLKDTDPRAKLESLLAARENTYAQADFVVDNPIRRDGSAVDDITEILRR